MSFNYNMDEAPKCGRTILLKHKCYGYDKRRPLLHRWVYKGDSMVQARFIDGRWDSWCGNPNTKTTNSLDPIAWMEVPT